MKIKDIDVSDEVADKIARKHNVSVEQVYEVFWNEYDRPLVRRSDQVPGAYLAYGRTEAGRYLLVAFSLGAGGRAKILTARDMTRAERRLYERR